MFIFTTNDINAKILNDLLERSENLIFAYVEL